MRYGTLLGLLTIAMAVPAGAQAPPAAAKRPQTAPPERIEEITVTARKREELLEDTPVSVTALGQVELQQTGVTQLDQINQLVPNLSFQSSTGTTTRAYIRGVGTADENPTFDSGVGIYVDGVFFGRAQGALLDILDITQVEVLRGPQGTLFGRNTAGGAINITTAKPQPEFSGHAILRAGNREHVTSQATLNIPLSFGPFRDKLFTRLTFGTADDRGHVRNEINGEHYGDRQMRSFLGSLRYVPSDALSLDVTGNYTSEQDNGRGGDCEFVQVPDLRIVPIFFPGYLDACRNDSSPYDFESDTPPLNELEAYGLWGTAGWNAGAFGLLDDLELKWINSWREQRTKNRLDLDGTAVQNASGLPLAQIAAAGEEETSPPGLDGEGGRFTTVTSELQSLFDAWGGRVHGVLGLYGFWENSRLVQGRRVFPGTPVFTGGGAAIDTVETNNWSIAAFGQATVDVTAWLALTGGVRRTEERKGFEKLSINPCFDFPMQCGVPSNNGLTRAPVDADESEHFGAWTPMAQMALTAPGDITERLRLDHWMTYFSYARGFKSGGFNGNIINDTDLELQAFDEETVDSFEVGTKLAAFDRRLTLNLAFFYSDYSDIQVQVQELVSMGVFQSTILVVKNAGEARIIGTEAELTALPFAGLLLQANFGLQDTEYLEFDGAQDALTGEDRDREGEGFDNIPRMQGRFVAQYDHFVDAAGPDWMDGILTPRVEVYAQSEVRFTGPELKENIQDAYGVLNARLGYTFADDSAEIALWGKNLTDEEYFDFALSQAINFGTTQRFFAPPLSYGIQVAYRF